MSERPGKNSPLLAAAALVGTGLLLRSWKSTAMDLPDAKAREHNDEGASKRLREARDGVARFMPANMMKSLGNSLLMMAGGIVILRVADELVDEKERLF